MSESKRITQENIHINFSRLSELSRLSDEQAGEVIKGVIEFASGHEREEAGDMLVEVMIRIISGDVERLDEYFSAKSAAGSASASARRKSVPNTSKPVPNTSKPVPNTSKPVPNTSESVRTLPKVLPTLTDTDTDTDTDKEPTPTPTPTPTPNRAGTESESGSVVFSKPVSGSGRVGSGHDGTPGRGGGEPLSAEDIAAGEAYLERIHAQFPAKPQPSVASQDSDSYEQFLAILHDPRMDLAATVNMKFGRGAWRKLIAAKGVERVRNEVDTLVHEIRAGEVPDNAAAVLTSRLKALPDARHVHDFPR